MLTIRTTGDDAWDTDLRLLDALTGYEVRIDGKRYELRGARDGQVLLLTADLTERRVLIDAHRLDIEVL